MILLISENAKADLRQIVYYIAKDKPTAARKWRKDFQIKCTTLLSSPEIGQTRDDIRKGLRMLPFGKYIIIYQIDLKIIRIMRVIHGARDIENLF